MNQKKSGLTKFFNVLTVADKATQTLRLEALFEASFEGIDTQESKANAATLGMLECLCVLEILLRDKHLRAAKVVL